MKCTKPLLPLSLFLWLTVAFAQTPNCSNFNKKATPYEFTPNGTQGHNSGQHNWSVTLGGSCSYTGTTPGAACANDCVTTVGAWLESETGSVTPVGYSHELGETQNLGQNSAPLGGATQCTVTAAVAVNSCILSCAVTISISASPNGAGASISFPAQAIFTQSDPYTVSCAAETLPSSGGGGGCDAENGSKDSCPGNPEYCPPPDDGGNSDCCDQCPTCTNCNGDGDILRSKSRRKSFNLSALDKKN